MITPTMTSLWQRSLESDVSSVKTTFSSWDKCMDKAYCKWPAIIGIVVVCLMVLSLVWSLARCLCCGAEMCCGCISCVRCCTSCCGNGRRRNKGYNNPEDAPPPQPYQQYQSAPPPMYGAPMYNTPAPQYAHFDASNQAKGAQKYNEDALPAMPSWDTAPTTRQRDTDMEMEKMPYASAQAAPMLPKTYQSGGAGAHGGDMGMMGGPQYQSPTTQHGYGQSSPYGMNQAANPYTDTQTGYGQPQQSYNPYGYSGQRQAGGYEPSVAAPPSYRTAAPSVAPPAIGRKPVSGSWRDL